jgi:hypothetical protein
MKPSEVHSRLDKKVFCNVVYATNAKGSICDECSIMYHGHLEVRNALSSRGKQSFSANQRNKLDSKLRDENYCLENLGSRAS